MSTSKKDDIVFVLIVYIYKNHLDALGNRSDIFLDFLTRSDKKELNEFSKVLFSLTNDGTTQQGHPLYVKAEMVEFSMTDEEAIAEFDRAADTLRLKNDKTLYCYLAEEMLQNHFSLQRAENLLKLLNLSSCLSDNEQQIIRLLNTYIANLGM